METETQKKFRKHIAEEMSKDELIDRLVEYHGKIEEYKKGEMSWDEIIGGIAEYLTLQPGIRISREEIFHYLVCYIQEKHPKFITRSKINWEELTDRYLEETIVYGPQHISRVFNFLREQPEFE